MRVYSIIYLILSLLLAACSSAESAVLRLATTTSTDNSGLLDAILDKAIAAAEAITVITKRPDRVYTDKEWEVNFAIWELDDGESG